MRGSQRVGALFWGALAFALAASAVAQEPERGRDRPARPQAETLPQALPPPMLAASYGFGEPIAFAVSPDATKGFCIEGTALSVLDLSKAELPELARLQVDAAVMDLAPAGNQLFIAGGAYGALLLDLDALRLGLQPIDQAEGRPCTSIAVNKTLIAATFAGGGDSLLRVYARDSRQKLGELSLPGKPFEIALRGDRAFIALGPAGVGAVDLQDPAKPKFQRGPDLRKLPVPAGFELSTGYVRELALLGERLYLAADAIGLVEIALDQPWLSPAGVKVWPLVLRDKPCYALRVDAHGERVAVGTSSRPSIVCDAAPHGLFGRYGWDLAPAEYAPDSYPIGAVDALWVFRVRAGGEPGLEAVQTLEPSTWRSLVVRGQRVYDQHLELGLVAREVSRELLLAEAGDQRTLLPGMLTKFGARPARGLCALDGKLALREPRLILLGVDAVVSDWRGLLYFTHKHVVEPAPGLEESPPLGISIGAQWIDVIQTREWFLASTARWWRIHRLTIEQGEPEIVSWDLTMPLAADTANPKARETTATGSFNVGELVIGTRSGTRQGLVGFSPRTIQIAADGQPAGTQLAVKPLWQLDTHAAAEVGPFQTFDVASAQLVDGRRILAVAAGCDTDPQSPTFQRPRIALFDVTHGLVSPPKKLGVVHAAQGPALALAVDMRSIQNRLHLFAATSSAGMAVFDVNEPEQPTQVGWMPPLISPYDGQPENLLDVEVWEDEATKRVVAYLACGRRGLVRVDVTQPSSSRLEPDVILPTPGFVSGLTSFKVGPARCLLVTDGRAGLRIYR